MSSSIQFTNPPNSEERARSSVPNANGHQIRRVMDDGGLSTMPVPSVQYPMAEESWGSSDFLQVVGLIVRRWPIMVATMIACIGLGVIYSLTAPPVYVSLATLEVNSNSNNGASTALPASFVGARDNSPETQAVILNGLPVLRGAMRRISPAALSQVLKYEYLAVLPVPETNLITVSVKSHDAHASAALANAVSQEYIQLSRDKNREITQGSIRYLKEQIGSLQARLDNAQKNLMHYKQANHIVDFTDQEKSLSDNVAKYQGDLETARADLQAYNAQLAKMRSMEKALPAYSIDPAQYQAPRETEDLRIELSRLQIEKIDLLEQYQPTYPKVKEVEDQIATVQQRLAHAPTSTVEQWVRKPNEVYDNLALGIATTQGQIRASEGRITSLAQGAAKAEADMASLPAAEYHLSRLTADLATLQAAYSNLNNQYQGLLLQDIQQVADAHVVFPAELGTRTGATPAAVLLYSLVLGIALALGIASLVDRLDDTVHSEHDAEQACRLPILAHVPMMKKSDQLHLTGELDMPMDMLENYRMLRTNIAFSAIDQPIRSLVITSSVPNEGKSSNSSNLAVAAASSGEKVILVDCDLRRPSLHRMFGLPNRIGFSNVVTGNATIEEALQETQIPGLYLLTSGPPPPNPFMLLSSEAARASIRQLTELADLVIFDTPPALALADAKVMAVQVDASLLVVSMREARKREIAHTRDLLAQTGTQLIGIVLNKLPTGLASGYGGNYQYRYYSSYFDSQADTPELKEAGQENNNGAVAH